MKWVLEHAESIGIEGQRIAVGGDSAGGNLAAAVTLHARAAQAPHTAFQLLIYPVLDAGMGSASTQENAEGYFLEKAGMEWFYGHYIPAGTDVRIPNISPCTPVTLPACQTPTL